MLILTLAEKGGDSKELSFDHDEIRVGRVRDNEIVLPKGNVSKHHCRLLVRGSQLLVEDLNSTNGTYVNGRKIAEVTPISAADKVFVGDFVIRLAGGLRAGESPLGGLLPTHLPSAPEAGSLSTALPRRPPPPPPPPRPGTLHPGEEDAAALSSRGGPLHPPPPPPPPPPKRESKSMPVASGEEGLSPPLPTEISLDDDEEMSPAPRLNLPPLRPPVLSPSPDENEPRTIPRGTAAPHAPHEAARPPAALPPPAPPPVTPPPGQPTLVPPGSATQLDGDYPPWLARLLDDEGVSAVFFSGTQPAEVERRGSREPATVAPADLAGLPDQLRRLAARGVPRPEPDASVIYTTLADGTRIAALFPPLSDHLHASIQRPNLVRKTLEDLASEGSLSPEMQQVLEASANTRQNMLIAGDRAACDQLLATLTWSLDRVARVLVLAETISPPASATAWVKLPVAAHQPDFVAAAVALRPDYIVADTAASVLSGDLLRECARGQNGAITTIIARSVNDALYRLRMMGATASSPAGDLLGLGLDVLVHVVTQADGSIRVMEIAEPTLGSTGELRAQTLLAWQSKSRGKGRFIATRTPSQLAGKLEAAGAAVTDDILQR